MLVLRWNYLKEGDISSWAEISAWLLFTIGFWFSRDLDARFSRLVRQLISRGVIAGGGEEDRPSADALLEPIQNRASRLGKIGLVVALVSFAVAYALVYQDRSFSPILFGFKMLLEAIATALAGRLGGRMVAYGFLGREIATRGLRIESKPGHPDAAGGLLPVGSFYLLQAGLVLLPALYFGFWWIVGPGWPLETGQFAQWRDLFALFFLLIVLLEVIAFAAPLLVFHLAMDRCRQRFLAEADEVAKTLLEVRAEAESTDDPESLPALEARRSQLEARYDRLAGSPAWPVDLAVRRRFTWGNVAVLGLPLIGKLPFVQKLIDGTLVNLLGK